MRDSPCGQEASAMRLRRPRPYISGGLGHGSLADARVATALVLRLPPVIHRRHAIDAPDRAKRCAPLRRHERPPDILDRIASKRHAGTAALLGAPVDEPLFTDVEVASAGAAAPFVGLAVGKVELEAADARIQI